MDGALGIEVHLTVGGQLRLRGLGDVAVRIAFDQRDPLDHQADLAVSPGMNCLVQQQLGDVAQGEQIDDLGVVEKVRFLTARTNKGDGVDLEQGFIPFLDDTIGHQQGHVTRRGGIAAAATAATGEGQGQNNEQ